MDIKVGQIYEDQDENQFLICEINKVGIATDEIILQSLQETNNYFIGEFIPIKEHYLRDFTLCEELIFTKVDDYKLKINTLKSENNFYKNSIRRFEYKQRKNLEEINKLEKEMKKLELGE